MAKTKTTIIKMMTTKFGDRELNKAPVDVVTRSVEIDQCTEQHTEEHVVTVRSRRRPPLGKLVIFGGVIAPQTRPA